MVVHESPVIAEGDDEDSLFGSPPPPQFEGRAGSPALALPSAASTHKGSSSASNIPVSVVAGIQNVGTIALPGSQPDSEFPIHPLALSLNHGTVPRPPALPQKQSQTSAASTSTSTGRSESTVTPSIAGPSRSTSRGSSSEGKGRSRPSQPRFQSEPGTEPSLKFTLPDPSASLPMHFLRSQENLLGKAGRVGGITTIPPQPRGSTPSNPILIDDDDDTPMIGRRHGSKSRETSQKPIDPIKLAQPTNEEIVSVLVGQRDIFPVLENILKLIAEGLQPKQPLPRPTGFERRRPGSPKHEWMGPPTKKRKLNRVPAGATDWDVPFPFADGEGPNAYKQNWERDRGKQLITELIKLIKVASRKAAAKKYFAQQNGESRETGGEKDVNTSKNIKGYYRPETALYDSQDSQLDTGVMSKGGHPPQLVPSSFQPAVPLSIPPSEGEIQQSLDRLLSSFMELPIESANFTSTPGATNAAQPPNISVPPTTIFDAWMNILDTFPIDSDGTGVVTQALSSETPNITAPLSVRSTPGLDDFDAILNSIMGTTPPVPTPSTSTEDNISSQDPFSSSLFDFTSISPTQPSTSVQDLPASSRSLAFNEFASNPNSIIDELNPLFFMPSATGSSASVNPSSGISEDLTQPSSPLPSASSESQAMTPASANWDLSLPDIFSGSGDGEGQGEEPIHLDLGRSSFGEKDLDVDFLSLQPPVIGKGKAMEVVGPLTTTKIIETLPQIGSVTQSVFNALLSTKTRDELLACISGTTPSTTPSTSTTAKSMKRSDETDSERSARLRRKEDIIRRAKERRQEIQESLNNIKRQLWETTIEQAALVNLTKKLEVDSNDA